MHLIRGALKAYDWGAVDGLAAWSGETTGGPQAELWFGAHPSGPSPLVDESGQPTGGTLADVIGPDDAPVLVKLLAAGRPLSIQVHPDASLAATGRFTDTAEKTEMVIALGEFRAHAGWRDPRSAAAILAGSGVPREIIDTVAAGDRETAIRALLLLGAGEPASPGVAGLVGSVAEAAAKAGLDPAAVESLAIIARLYPTDPGVLVAVLLDHALLAPGEGLFLPAGVVHSYVEGLTLEVMTSSDNVLRLGMTTKAIAIDDALAAIRADREPARIPLGGRAEGAPFSAEVTRTGGLLPGGGYRVVLALDGRVQVSVAGQELCVPVGCAAAIGAGDADAHVRVDGTAAIVREGPG